MFRYIYRLTAKINVFNAANINELKKKKN